MRKQLMKGNEAVVKSAILAGCPLVPAVLRGTRRALAPSGALPRPGALELEILAPLEPNGAPADQAAVVLRERARAAILGALGEPDLTCSADTARPPGTAPRKSVPANRL